jgi:hypothetical protein
MAASGGPKVVNRSGQESQKKRRDRKPNPRSDIMATTANAANVTSRAIARTIFRWTHIAFAIPILGYIYSPFDKLPSYAFKTRFIFVPVMVLSGLWMWKGHVVRRLIWKRRAKQGAPVSASPHVANLR